MAEGFINLTEGSGKKAHTWNRTIGANDVHDEFTLPGEYPLASYVIVAAMSSATANSHLLQIMAGASLNVRIRRITLEQSANATTAQGMVWEFYRLTTAGTGGTTITPRPFDSGDAAAGATAMSLPTVKGTEGVQLGIGTLAMRQAYSATAAQVDDMVLWQQHPGAKPFIIPAGTSNGFAIKNPSGVAAGTVQINVEVVETSFL